MTDYKHQYEQMKKIVEKYQDEIVPRMMAQIEELEAMVADLKKTFQGEGDEPCDICKHGEQLAPCDESDFNCRTCEKDCVCKSCDLYDKWEWRGHAQTPNP